MGGERGGLDDQSACCEESGECGDGLSQVRSKTSYVGVCGCTTWSKDLFLLSGFSDIQLKFQSFPLTVDIELQLACNSNRILHNLL